MINAHHEFSASLQIPFFCLSNIQTQRLIVNDISVYMLPGVTYS